MITSNGKDTFIPINFVMEHRLGQLNTEEGPLVGIGFLFTCLMNDRLPSYAGWKKDYQQF